MYLDPLQLRSDNQGTGKKRPNRQEIVSKVLSRFRISNKIWFPEMIPEEVEEWL